MAERAGPRVSSLQDGYSEERLRRPPRLILMDRTRGRLLHAGAAGERTRLRWPALLGRRRVPLLLRYPRPLLRPERLHLEIVVAVLEQLVVRAVQYVRGPLLHWRRWRWVRWPRHG